MRVKVKVPGIDLNVPPTRSTAELAPDWMDAAHAAWFLQIGTTSLRACISRGEVQATKRGGVWWINRDHLLNLVGRDDG